MDQVIDWVAAGSLGLLVGLIELAFLCRSAPLRAIGSSLAFAYLVLNIAASVAALVLVRRFGWVPSAELSLNNEWLQVLVAGFGAFVILRISFTVTIADHPLVVNPGKGFDTLRSLILGSIQSQEANRSLEAIEDMMGDVPFDRLVSIIVPLCNRILPLEKQRELKRKIDKLEHSATPEKAKRSFLGLLLTEYVPEKFLQGAVRIMRPALLEEVPVEDTNP